MRPTRLFPTALVWGLAWGAAFGAWSTRAAALHLLAKNRALAALGVTALPGTGYAETLAGPLPAWAGALFFGLSLGLGWGALCGLWASASRALPGRWGRWAPWLLLIPGAWAAWFGDYPLAAALLLIGLGPALLGSFGERPSLRPMGLWLLLTVLVAAGFGPWAAAPEGPFTRLRDRYLLTSPLGLAVDELYYRWTLYPAEVLKPLAALSQPTAGLTRPLTLADNRGFCSEALSQGILCLSGDGPGADFRVFAEAGDLELSRKGTQTPWPVNAADRRQDWQAFSRASDTALAVRRATGLALFVGCPLGLCGLIAALAAGVGAAFPAGRARVGASAGLALAAALGLAAAALSPGPVKPARLRPLPAEGPLPVEALRRHLESSNPVERFYAARAAARAGRAATSLLVDALSDPVINVRYAAAQALGSTGGAQARKALLEVLGSPEAWYVKERAYAALWRLDWRPR